MAAPAPRDCAPPDPTAPTAWTLPASAPCKITLRAQLPAHAGPITAKSGGKSPDFQDKKENHIQRSYLLFLMATLNHKGFKHTENKFELIKSCKAMDFEEVWF